MTFVGEGYSSPPDYAIGDRVRVLYDRTNPLDARVDGFWETWLFPLIFAAIGSACIGGGALELRNTLRERARAPSRKR